MHFYEKEIKT